MTGYVVSKGGTFGVATNCYRTEETGEEMVVIRWGPLQWLTPVRRADCKLLTSRYASEARAEAERWLAEQG